MVLHELYSDFEVPDMLFSIYGNNLYCSVNSIQSKVLLRFEEKVLENILNVY